MRIGILFLAVCCLPGQCFGQGTLHVTFDGPPTQPQGTSFVVQQYFELGMWFRPLGVVGPGNGFSRVGGGAQSPPFVPDNGTAYIRTGLGDSLMFSFTNGSSFQMVSVDLAEFSVTVTNIPVIFVGYYKDGNTVTVTFTPDGIIDGTGPLADFETLYFGKEWADLTRVEIPNFGWSLDNLVVSVPEPTSGALLLLSGGVVLLGLRKGVAPYFLHKIRSGWLSD